MFSVSHWRKFSHSLLAVEDSRTTGEENRSKCVCVLSPCQTLVLMSDLATILDLQGHHDEALALVQQAVELGRTAQHPDQHVLLGNMAGVLMHTGEKKVPGPGSDGQVKYMMLHSDWPGRLEEAGRVYQEALGLARQAGDQEALEHLQEGLKELKRRSQERKKEQK